MSSPKGQVPGLYPFWCYNRHSRGTQTSHYFSEFPFLHPQSEGFGQVLSNVPFQVGKLFSSKFMDNCKMEYIVMYNNFCFIYILLVLKACFSKILCCFWNCHISMKHKHSSSSTKHFVDVKEVHLTLSTKELSSFIYFSPWITRM